MLKSARAFACSLPESRLRPPTLSSSRAGWECDDATVGAGAPLRDHLGEQKTVGARTNDVWVLPTKILCLDELHPQNPVRRSGESRFILSNSDRLALSRTGEAAVAIPEALPRGVRPAGEDGDEIDRLRPIEKCGARQRGIVEVRREEKEATRGNVRLVWGGAWPWKREPMEFERHEISQPTAARCTRE